LERGAGDTVEKLSSGQRNTVKSKSDTHSTIPVAQERLRVDKRVVETDRVRISTRVEPQPAWVREELAREDVQVEWVQVDREVSTPPQVRTEGDTLIVPLFEEVLVVEKRLVLRQELHVKRRTIVEPYEERVTLLRTHVDVQRDQPPKTDLQMKGSAMTRTLTAMYDSRDDAERARDQLVSAGIPADGVHISSTDGQSSAASETHHGDGIIESIKHFFMADEDRHAYSEGMRRGGCLLTASVREDQVDQVVQLLDQSGAVDFDAREQEWRGSGWAGAASRQSDERSEGDGVIPIAEERLAVGKREVERGTVRVRSYVVEEPVRQEVNLREEHVSVERTPVNERTAGQTPGVFEERSFEVTERGEEPVVGKETVVTEELRVRKDVDERTETVEDTVRHTEVDLDDERADRHRGVRGDDGREDLPRGPAGSAR
jgi:uncharacterized protein (TIGR02271 family)